MCHYNDIEFGCHKQGHKFVQGSRASLGRRASYLPMRGHCSPVSRNSTRLPRIRDLLSLGKLYKTAAAAADRIQRAFAIYNDNNEPKETLLRTPREHNCAIMVSSRCVYVHRTDWTEWNRCGRRLLSVSVNPL